MEDLQKMIESYLNSDGYEISDAREGFLVADRPELGGDRDIKLFWVPPSSIEVGDDFEILEDRLNNEFEAILPQYPDAKYYMVADSLEGFSKDFAVETKKRRIKMKVPINFFDAPFRQEENPSAYTTIKNLRDTELSIKRVAQPYYVVKNGHTESSGDDLLVTLRNEFLQQKNPCLRIIVGPAGAGKTVLFKALFSHLYNSFQDKKRRAAIFPRPTPFIPEHLRQTSTMRVQELIEKFIRSEIAASLPQETLEWLLLNGFSFWLFDGLEELYSGDPDFFDYLLDLITRPKSKAQILICIRNSLLQTSDNLISFLNEFGQEDSISLYKLADWDYSSKRTFAWISLEERIPQKGENDTSQVTQFLSEINKSDTLKSLSGLPYYCKILLDEFMYGNSKDFSNDFELIKHSVSGIIKREIGKKVLSLDQLEPGGLDEWLEILALESYEKDFKGLSKGEVEEWAATIIRTELSSEEFNNVMTTLIQFPIFDAGEEPGIITFKHDLIIEYLVGKFFFEKLSEDPKFVADRLRRKIDFTDTFVTRYITHHLKEDEEKLFSISETLRSGVVFNRAFANLLQLLLFSSSERNVIQNNKINLENRDLSHVQFSFKDLRGLSFRNCNLSNTVFKNCDLRDCLFEGAQLAGTKFEQISGKELNGAYFGDLRQFEFIFWNKNRIDEFKKMKEWIGKNTDRFEDIEEPCPTALQIKKLFLKFINPDGSARRIDLPETALIRGKKISDAPPLQDCVKACIKHGYLQDTKFRNRIKRSPGDRYGDMVSFVKDLGITTEIRQLLNSLCPIKGCRHVI